MSPRSAAQPAATEEAARRALDRQIPNVSTVDEREFRDVVGTFPTGVTIVTACGSDGPAGLTTNAFASLSLEPPLILVCFDNRSRTLPVVRECGRFAVNILRAGQEELAAIFASKRVQAEKFAEVTHTVQGGVPVLDDALAWLVCDVQELLPRGDHTIGIGAVTALAAFEGAPLVFHKGEYWSLSGG
jgi:3-hydroxy-9,10-secoandrosta-1,3,5(10)-triene-9,17-dione monooxygenase reductase component